MKSNGRALTDDLAIERTRLANERTLLAYIRTGLAIIAAGFGMEQFLVGAARASGSAVMLAGVVTLGIGIARFISAKRELREMADRATE